MQELRSNGSSTSYRWWGKDRKCPRSPEHTSWRLLQGGSVGAGRALTEETRSCPVLSSSWLSHSQEIGGNTELQCVKKKKTRSIWILNWSELKQKSLRKLILDRCAVTLATLFIPTPFPSPPPGKGILFAFVTPYFSFKPEWCISV